MTKDEARSILPGGKWHEVAMKWVDDPAAVLQYRSPNGDGVWRNQSDVGCGSLANDYDWRIKPQTLRYRVALMRVNKCVFPTIVTCGNQAESLAHNPGFERWATDWQEVEA